MLKRKLLQAAVQNRAGEAWRRENRLYRIVRFLNLGRGWESDFRFGNLFPTSDQRTNYTFPRGIPRDVGEVPVEREVPGSHVVNGFTYLPEFLTRLERLDFFLRVEKNALFFETHIGLEPPPASDSRYLDSPLSTVKNLLQKFFRSFQ